MTAEPLKEIEPHDCFQSSKVEKCDGEEDERRCLKCGKTWTEPCNFDDDYS